MELSATGKIIQKRIKQEGTIVRTTETKNGDWIILNK